MENAVNENLSETEKKEIGARFLQAFKEALHLEDKAKIAKILGYEDKKGGVIYKIADGKQELNFSKLEKFSRVTGYSIHWLITGDLPKIVKRIDFKNLWARLIKAWETEIESRGDRSLNVELNSAKEMAQRNFMPDFEAIVERVSTITHTPLLWLLTGEGPARADKPFENQPAYLADLILEYKVKEKLPLPLKNKLMITKVRNGDYLDQLESVEKEAVSLSIPFSSVEEAALKELAERSGKTVREKIRDLVVSHLLIQGTISLEDILAAQVDSSLQMTGIVAKTGTSTETKKERA